MAAPEYVPLQPARHVRAYASPPRRPESWMADRPGDLTGLAPDGPALGSPGPDQGYALTLAARLVGTLSLGEGEHESDALAVISALGMKRASTFTRAPILADLRIAARLWGLLGPTAPPDLVALRRHWFEEAHHRHHYMRLRAIVDATPVEFLHRPVDAIEADLDRDAWAGLLSFRQ